MLAMAGFRTFTDVEGSTHTWLRPGVCGIRRPRAIERVGDRFDDGGVDTDHTNWVDAIDVCEHHCIDFDAVAAPGNRIVVARAGRGTRQDARWIEHVRAARASRLDVASYWHLYPSHTTPHHQAELWVASIRGDSPWPFTFGHWADISSSDGFDPFELGRYVASFLRRADELLGDTVGVFATDEFWDRHVRFDWCERRASRSVGRRRRVRLRSRCGARRKP